jgi:hypothetical protein
VGLKARLGAIAFAAAICSWTSIACIGSRSAPPTVTFTGREFNFEGPTVVPAGVVHFGLLNAGTRAHMLGIVALANGKTANDLLHDVQAHPGQPFPAYATQIGGPDAVDPGMESVAFATLKPGDYAVYCLMPDGNSGTTHLDHGMIKGFRVSGSSSASSPQATLNVDAFEFGYTISGAAAAGEQLIQVRNTGRQQHEAQLARLPNGVSVDDYIGLNDATSTAAGSSYGGIAPLSPGGDGTFSVYLTPGNYAFICFVPDPATGKAHFELGQVQQFSVH